MKIEDSTGYVVVEVLGIIYHEAMKEAAKIYPRIRLARESIAAALVHLAAKDVFSKELDPYEEEMVIKVINELNRA